MGTKVDRLQEQLGTADGQKMFVEWYANPTTQLMLAAAREAARPIKEYLSDATAIIGLHGESVGANNILDFLETPWTHGRGAGGDLGAERKRPPKPTYGAEGILKETSDGN